MVPEHAKVSIGLRTEERAESHPAGAVSWVSDRKVD